MILITGGAGFIGSHLSEKLVNQGNEVIIFDNFNDYYDVSIKENNIDEIKSMIANEKLDENLLHVIRGDIRNKQEVSELFDQFSINCVVHLAAMAGVRPSIEMPDLYFDVNINGTVNILEACKLHNIKSVVFASSSSVYGNNKKVPFSENDSVDRPISPYAATKKSGELLCHTYYHLYNMNFACLRFFTVYGPRQRPDLAIHKFINLGLEGSEIPFYGDGSTERDYTYIEDIIDGITKSMAWVDSSDRRFGVFNLGESETISLSRMVHTLENALGKKFKIRKLPCQPGDVNKTYSDISLSREILGYEPKTSFEDGISKFVEWKLRNI